MVREEMKKEGLPPKYYTYLFLFLIPILMILAYLYGAYGPYFFGFKINSQTRMFILPKVLFISSLGYTIILISSLYLYFKIGMRTKGKHFVTIKKVKLYDTYPILVFLLLSVFIISEIIKLLKIYWNFSTISIWILSYIAFILIYFITYFVAKGKRKKL